MYGSSLAKRIDQIINTVYLMSPKISYKKAGLPFDSVRVVGTKTQKLRRVTRVGVKAIYSAVRVQSIPSMDWSFFQYDMDIRPTIAKAID